MFAISQPLLSLFANNPEFLAARGSNSGEIFSLVAVLVVFLPACLCLIYAFLQRINPQSGRACLYLLILILVTLICPPILKRLPFVPDTLTAFLSLGLSVVFLAAYIRIPPVKQILTILAIASIVFPVWFLLGPAMKPLVFPENITSRQTTGSDNPINVVLVILDELPLYSILDDSGSINSQRYPNFAKLASVSTWYPKATTVSDFTGLAIPAILTGKYPPAAERLPIYMHHPDNLFTLLEKTHHINAVEAVGSLCPKRLCSGEEEDNWIRLRALLSDSFIVYLHIVTPEKHTGHLPPVDQTWEGFASEHSDLSELKSGRFISEKNFRKAIVQELKKVGPYHFGHDQQSPFYRFYKSIENTDGARFDYLHLLLPHFPFTYLPSGKTYDLRKTKRIDGLAKNQWLHKWPAIQAQQRYLLQLAYTDTLLGKLIAKLKEENLFDDSLIVITSDHGNSFRVEDNRRALSSSNYMDVLPIPLFIKYPGQAASRVDRRNVENIDVYPTIADVLNIRVPHEVDGISLARDPNETQDLRRKKHARQMEDMSLQTYSADIELTGRNEMIKIFGLGPEDIYRHGPHAEIIGSRPMDHRIIEHSGISLDISLNPAISSYDPASEFAPTHLSGTLSDENALATHGELELELAIVLNGVIETTVRSYRQKKGVAFTAMLPESALVSGNNEVKVYGIDQCGKEICLVAYTEKNH